MKRGEVMVGRGRVGEVEEWRGLMLFDAAGNSKQPFI